MTAPRHFLPLLAALALSPIAAPHAHAGDVERAEHTRLGEEMRKLASRNAWTAVEANFARLEELEKKGEVISYKEFMLGAEASRALGDMTASRARAERAAKVDPAKEALDWLADVDANYGRVAISFDGRYAGDRALVATSPPFAPDQRASLAFATAQVAGGKGFTGLLPVGEYSVGGQKVTVATGGAVAPLVVGPPPAPPREPFKLAYVGPRAQVGVSFTAAGAVNEAGLADPSTNPQAVAFSGSGARVGVGLEVGISPTIGLIAEVGYHNLFGAPVVGDSPLAERDEYLTGGNNIHMGYGWLAGSLRLGDLWIAAGPIWGAGSGVVAGVAGSCDGLACADDFPDSAEEGAAYQRLTGDITAGGAAASLSYAIVDLGSLRGAITLSGGAQTDSYRMYPWGQLAFSVAPATSRRKE